MKKPIKEPIITINWEELIKDVSNVLKFIVQVIEFILKIIIKIATFLVLGMLISYKGLRKFWKSDVKGIWIFLIVIFFAVLLNIVIFYKEKEIKQVKEEVIKAKQQQEQISKQFKDIEKKIDDLQVYIDTGNTAENFLSPSLTRFKGDIGNSIRWKELVKKYFPSEQVNNALLVMACESGGNPEAINKDDAKITGHCSYGLFQINGPDNWEWDNPEKNISKASTMFLARGWRPWFNCSKELKLI